MWMWGSKMIRLLFTTNHGPAECRIALRHALDALAKDAGACGCSCDIAESAGADAHGPPSALALIASDDDPACAQALASCWTGAIVWVCKSPLRPHHPRKNWFVAAIELPPPPELQALSPSDVRFETLRAGGPGGQHQNKTESAVRATHMPSGLSVVARDGRSQHRNKALALERLSSLLSAQGELAASRDDRMIHESHAKLERGGAARRFVGPAFLPA